MFKLFFGTFLLGATVFLPVSAEEVLRFNSRVIGAANNAVLSDWNAIIGDYNGDGKDDFILREKKGSWKHNPTVHLSKGDGTFTKELLKDYQTMKGDLTNIIVGDYNGDGKDDFIRQEKGGWDDDDLNTANIYWSKGDGTFTKELLKDYKTMKGDFTNIIVGDYNGDGEDDFIRQEKGLWDNDGVNTAHVYLSMSLRNGGRSFFRKLLPDHKILKGDLTNIIVGDYNGDGKDDFIRQEKGVWDDDNFYTANIYLSNGDGTFTSQLLTDHKNMKGDLTNLIVGDYNGDGKDDFLRQEKGYWDDDDLHTAYFYLSNGDGTFTPKLLADHQQLKGDKTDLIVGDFNGDGLDDLFDAKSGGNHLKIRLTGVGDRYPSFEGTSRYSIIADFNGDSISDLLVQATGTGVVTIRFFSNITSGEYALKNAARQFSAFLNNEQWMMTVFGSGYDRGEAKLLAEKIEENDMTWLPSVKPFDPATSSASIKGVTVNKQGTGIPVQVNGAYKEGTVYWSNALVDVEENEFNARLVAIQELAHHIDFIVNPNGKHIGGEGVLAVAKIFGPPATSQEINTLKNYRDHFDIDINGTKVYGAELGFGSRLKFGVVAFMSVVAVMVTAGVATPGAVAAIALAATMNTVINLPPNIEPVNTQNVANLETHGNAITASRATRPRFSDRVLNHGGYSGVAGSVSEAELDRMHSYLERQGYVFVGYHGTTNASATTIIDTGIVRQDTTLLPPWDGFYLADDPNVALRYAFETLPNRRRLAGQLVRIYLPTQQAQQLRNIDIPLDNAQAASAVIHNVGQANITNGTFLFRGLESLELNTTETVLGWDWAVNDAVALPSNYTVRVPRGTMVPEFINEPTGEAGTSTPVGLAYEPPSAP